MRRFFLKLYRRRRLQRDLEQELAFHREMSGEQQNPIPLGNIGLIKEHSFDLWRFNFIENIGRDLIFAARGFRRSPALAISALVSLGLGIGVNTAIFSLGMEFLFSQPSVRDARSLLEVRLGGSSNSPEDTINSLKASGLFADVTGENIDAYANFNNGTETSRVFDVYTTNNYFNMLGVPMLQGRGFIPADSKEVVVLSYRFWQRYFHGDPAVVGRAINLDGRACTVVGILPEHHRTLIGLGLSPDVYQPRWLETTELVIYARLKPDMSIQQARAGLEIVAKRIDAGLPAEHRKYAQNIKVAPVVGYERFFGEPQLVPISVFFALLWMVVGLVLLIACVNVAILLLARGSARRGEIAVRLALGVSRARLLQQFLAESVLLAILGAGLGLLLSQATVKLLAAVEIPVPVPIHLQITPDWRLLIYSAVLTGLATIVCGLFPAWQSLKVSITRDLTRERKSRLRSALVVAQIAISVIVLTTGFLFLRNLVNANSISPGFDVRHTVHVEINLPAGRYSKDEKKAQYVERVLREIEALPGIERVAAATVTPFNGNETWGVRLKFADTGQEANVQFKGSAVTPGYFQTMNIPVYAGRTFSGKIDGEQEVIVNRLFAQRYLGNRDVVGTTFSWHAGQTYRVVGVVEGTKTWTIGEEPQPQLYLSFAQVKDERLGLRMVVRSLIPPAQQLEPIRRTLHRIDPMAGVEVKTMYASIGLAFFPSQIGAGLLGSIGILGLLLATIGLYAVVAYSVVQRTREIGIRIAVGATRNDISRMVLRNAARLTLTGSAIGLFAALFITRPLAMFLVPGLKANDPLTFGAVVAVMILTGLIAAAGPTRRALKVDPNTALRYE